MKASRMFRLLAAIGLILTILSLNMATVSAARPEEAKLWPPPITEPSKAVPFSHPDKSTVNPQSPLYNPKGLYGPQGTRFGPPGQKSGSMPVSGGLDEVGHRWFGTAITTTNVDYTYAHHSAVSDLSIPSGTTLYAPTMLGTNDSPIEIVTRYWWDGNTLKREIAVYDHMLSVDPFVESVPFHSDYIQSGFYAAEILLYDGWWYA